jgi:hypothetical protein
MEPYLKIPMDIRYSLGRLKVEPLFGTLHTYNLPLYSLTRTRRIYLAAQLPVYFALSYVWGASTHNREILIEGKSLPITDNLYDALRAMQKEAKEAITVWADALFICQPEFAERSAQILLMREIYHTSADVRVYLGPSIPDALSLQFINYLAGANTEVEDLVDTEDDRWDEWTDVAVNVPLNAVAAGVVGNFSEQVIPLLRQIGECF